MLVTTTAIAAALMTLQPAPTLDEIEAERIRDAARVQLERDRAALHAMEEDVHVAARNRPSPTPQDFRDCLAAGAYVERIEAEVDAAGEGVEEAAAAVLVQWNATGPETGGAAETRYVELAAALHRVSSRMTGLYVERAELCRTDVTDAARASFERHGGNAVAVRSAYARFDQHIDELRQASQAAGTCGEAADERDDAYAEMADALARIDPILARFDEVERSRPDVERQFCSAPVPDIEALRTCSAARQRIEMDRSDADRDIRELSPRMRADLARFAARREQAEALCGPESADQVAAFDVRRAEVEQALDMLRNR